MSRFVELSHPIEPGMTTYPGIPGPVVTTHLSREASRGRYAEGTTFEMGRVDLVANTGTYIDAPRHRFAEGVDIAGLPLERLADLPGVRIDATAAETIALRAIEVRSIRAAPSVSPLPMRAGSSRVHVVRRPIEQRTACRAHMEL